MKIYLAHQISGLSYEEVHAYYTEMTRVLGVWYEILHPMTAKGTLRTELEFKAADYRSPVATNHAIAERDEWMVAQADVVFVNLLGNSHVSIGCVCELAWAHLLRKHTVVVMEEENIHQHAFILECADIVFATQDEAVGYLAKLATGQW